MKVKIEKTFPMPASAQVAWALLQDIEGVAGCMPGAAITERLDSGHYKGTVSVRVGPASMSFRGTVEVKGVDEPTRTLRLLGKGTDSTGTSGASMDLSARIESGASGAADACDLVGVSEVSMSGKAATFGGRMMGAVADQVLKQFAANFAAKAQALQALHSAPAGTSSGAGRDETMAPDQEPFRETIGVGEPFRETISVDEPFDDTASTGAVPAAAPTVRPAPAPPRPVSAPRAAPAALPATAAQAGGRNEINGLALLWAVCVDWLRGLFGLPKR